MELVGCIAVAFIIATLLVGTVCFILRCRWAFKDVELVEKDLKALRDRVCKLEYPLPSRDILSQRASASSVSDLHNKYYALLDHLGLMAVRELTIFGEETRIVPRPKEAKR